MGRDVQGSVVFKRLLVAVAVALGAAILGLISLAHPQGAQARPRRAVAFFNRETYDFTSRLPPAADGRRYAYMVLQSTDSRLVRRLRVNHSSAAEASS